MPRSRRPTGAPVAPEESSADAVVLPDFEASALSYLGPPVIEVDLFDRTWTVPALTARDWLEVLWEDRFDPDEIFPGLLKDPELDDEIAEALLEGTQGQDELFDIAMEILEESAGLKWWFALRLATSIRVSWHRIGGMIILSGMDPSRLSLGSWLHGVLAVIGERTAPKGFANLLHELNTPPEGFGPSPEDVMTMDESAFLAAMNGPF